MPNIINFFLPKLLRFHFKGTNYATCNVAINKRGRSKGFGLVTFNSKANAQDAINVRTAHKLVRMSNSLMQKKNREIINGRPISVGFFTSRKLTEADKATEYEKQYQELEEQLHKKEREQHIAQIIHSAHVQTS